MAESTLDGGADPAYLDAVPAWRVVVALALVGLAASWIVAVQDPVPGSELDVTVVVNDLPDWIADVLYPVMQFGTLAGPVVGSPSA